MFNQNFIADMIFYVAIYVRLSRDDNVKDNESLSITNQIAILKTYVQKQGWIIYDIYADDGYSGTNFDNRPEFNRMKRDIENGKVNLVITKDLSRLGRNYAEAGQYMDMYFPQHNVRYIALHDGVDSFDSTSVRYAPMRNVMNDDYARDISIKVRMNLDHAAKQGYFMGNCPPYGYLRSPENKHKLVPDEYAAKIVQRIFKEYANGNSARGIAEELTEEKILPPKAYFDRILKDKISENKFWGAATITAMLKNEVYLGTIINGKRGAINYKLKKRIAKPRDQWVIMENMHEAIIDRDLWELVKKRFKGNRIWSNHKKRPEVSLFSGLLRCADCGGAMTFTAASKNHKYDRYRCSTYTNKGKDTCSAHLIHKDKLVEIVTEELKAFAVMAKKDQKGLLERIKSSNDNFQSSKKILLSNKLHKNEERVAKLQERLISAFEDKCEGVIEMDTYRMLESKFKKEIASLNDENKTMKVDLKQCTDTEQSAALWLKRLIRFVSFKELTREMLVELIDKIEVWERVPIDNHYHQRIRIYYRFIGAIENITKKSEVIYNKAI